MEEYTVISGRRFNELYKHERFVKLASVDEDLEPGLNVDTESFDPNNSLKPGGISFIAYEEIDTCVNGTDEPIFYFCFVSIPDDASVYHTGSNFTSDKLILGECIEISGREDE